MAIHQVRNVRGQEIGRLPDFTRAVTSAEASSYSNERDQDSGAQDQPPHTLLKTQHQGENSEGELAEICEISQGRNYERIPYQKATVKPVCRPCWNESKDKSMQD